MKLRKHLLALCLFLSLAVAFLLALPTEAQAATVASGKCGKNVTWSLDENGTLTLSGTGPMYDYMVVDNPAPYYKYVGNIKTLVVQEGVTAIGGWSFGDHYALTTATLPESVTTIGPGAFLNCQRLSSVTLGSRLTSLGNQVFMLCAFKSIVLPSTLNHIDCTAFQSCPNLTTIYFTGTEEQLKTALDPFQPYQLGADKIYYNYLKIHTQPVSAEAPVGGYVTVNLTAVGSGLTYKWYYKDKNATSFTHTPTFTGNYYRVQMSDARNGRQIYCVITDASGRSVTSKTVTLSITTGPAITKQPVSVKVIANQTAKVTVSATGHKLSYKWYYADKGSSTFAYTSTFTSNSYYVTMNDVRNGRQVYCVITDSTGKSVKTQTVTLSMAAKPKITKQPASVKVAANQTAKVTFTASGEGLTYQWYYKNAGKLGFIKTDAFTGNTYSIDMTSARNGRQLYCVVTDKYGQTAQTNTVTISMATMPKITKQPTSVKVAKGVHARIDFTATGEGLTYQWYYKNADATSFTYTSTFTSNTYAAQMNADRSHRQLYCVVTDKYGQSIKTNTVTISMDKVLKISKQPANVKVAAKQTATVNFSVIGEGLTYQWYYKNPGSTAFAYTPTFTTSKYTTEMSSSRNGRQLYCVITDKYGQSVRTNTVTISMAAAPKITKQLTGASVFNNENINLSFSASGEGLTYKWYYANKGSSTFLHTKTFTGKFYNTQMTAERDGRRIYCLVTDKYGQTVKTATVTLTMKKTVKITQQPQTVKADSGATASTKVVATGDGLTYKWYYKDKGSSKFQLTTTYKTNTYSVQMNKARDGREIYCVVTDKYGNSQQTETVVLLSRKPAIKATVKTKTWRENGLYCGSVSVSSVTGGNGEYTYMYDVYVDEYSSTPALRSPLTSDKSYEFESQYSLSDVIVCAYIFDAEGNATAYLVNMNGKVLDTITVR